MNPVELFEAEFRGFVGSRHAVAVCNGSAALHTALLALGLKPKMKVVTTPFTFISTVNAILHCGATPVFADIVKNDSNNNTRYNINPNEVKKQVKLNKNVWGVLAVHLFGKMADVEDLRDLCYERGLALAEDSSQALGAKHKGRFAGTWGHAGTFSFYASKPLWTFEGGMMVTDSDEVAERAQQIRNHGLDQEGKMIRMGYNYKLNWLSAFIGETMLRLHKPAILAELGRYGPEDGYYPHVVYDHPYYKKLGISGNCPIAEGVASRVRRRLFPEKA